MSTGNTVISALFLCLTAGEVSGNAVTVIMSRDVRYPEIPCALALIPPLFQRADNDSVTHPPRLFVFGKSDWLDAFLRGFPSVATISVFTSERENILKGQLLGFITVPPENREINSWQDWLESDLVLLADDTLSVRSAIDLGLHGLTEERIDRTRPYNTLRVIATWRNASMLVTKHHYEMSIREKWIQPEIKDLLSRLHILKPVDRQYLRSGFITMKGSPFEVHLRKILGRIRAAGGHSYDRNFNIGPQATAESKNKPISLRNLMPVFAAYIVGNIFAVLAFSLEFSLISKKILPK
ncbi:Ionotropic receptor 263 [Frankliniella occidentalis]|nr:Ionotropic receptor 263 [Frankliniella occidentalis]